MHAVEEPSEADIVWTHMQVDDEFRKAASLRSDQYVNQFPSESCVVMKHNLAETMQKVFVSGYLEAKSDLGIAF